VRALRSSPDFLLPLAPFLDDWGAMIARRPQLTAEDRAAVVEALIAGCMKIPNQAGYYRALHGFAEAEPGSFQETIERLPAAARRDFRSLRKQVDLPRVSFESRMKKIAASYRKR